MFTAHGLRADSFSAAATPRCPSRRSRTSRLRLRAPLLPLKPLALAGQFRPTGLQFVALLLDLLPRFVDPRFAAGKVRLPRVQVMLPPGERILLLGKRRLLLAQFVQLRLQARTLLLERFPLGLGVGLEAGDRLFQFLHLPTALLQLVTPGLQIRKRRLLIFHIGLRVVGRGLVTLGLKRSTGLVQRFPLGFKVRPLRGEPLPGVGHFAFGFREGGGAAFQRLLIRTQRIALGRQRRLPVIRVVLPGFQHLLALGEVGFAGFQRGLPFGESGFTRLEVRLLGRQCRRGVVRRIMTRLIGCL